MGHGHSHHQHGPSCAGGHALGADRGVALAFGLTFVFMAVEALGGWWTGSLALVSDAGHMMTDAGALGLSLVTLRLSRRPATDTKTYGYRRMEVLAALLNGLALWGLVGILLREAWERAVTPQPVSAPGMTLIAALGLGVNLACAAILHRHRHENLNLRGAFLHVAADLFGSLGALAAGLVIWRTGWTLIDPLASAAICLLILWSSWSLVRDAAHSLLLGVPPHLDARKVEAALLAHPDVCCLYDFHLWSISTGRDALSAHVVVRAGADPTGILRDLERRLAEGFGIRHSTLQLEYDHDRKDERESYCARTPGQEPCGGEPLRKH